MSAKEAVMLDGLRDKEFKALTDAEYKAIRDEVESKGIRALRGSSAQIVFAGLRKRQESMKKSIVEKHGHHDQSTHGRWAKDDSEGEFANTEGLHPKHTWKKDDSEGEFGPSNTDEDMQAMDEMDLRHPPKPESYYQQFYRPKTTVALWIREAEKLTQQNRRKGMSEKVAQSTAQAEMESKYKTKLKDLAIANPNQIPDLRP